MSPPTNKADPITNNPIGEVAATKAAPSPTIIAKNAEHVASSATIIGTTTINPNEKSLTAVPNESKTVRTVLLFSYAFTIVSQTVIAILNAAPIVVASIVAANFSASHAAVTLDGVATFVTKKSQAWVATLQAVLKNSDTTLAADLRLFHAAVMLVGLATFLTK